MENLSRPKGWGLETPRPLTNQYWYQITYTSVTNFLPRIPIILKNNPQMLSILFPLETVPYIFIVTSKQGYGMADTNTSPNNTCLHYHYREAGQGALRLEQCSIMHATTSVYVAPNIHKLRGKAGESMPHGPQTIRACRESLVHWDHYVIKTSHRHMPLGSD